VKSELASLESVYAGRHRAPPVKLFDFRRLPITGSKGSPHERSDMRVRKGQFHFRLVTAQPPHVALLIRATMLGLNRLIRIPAVYSIVAIDIKQFIVAIAQVANGDTPAATINSQSAKALVFFKVQSGMARIRYKLMRAISTRS
jgi:hypothetical protein